MRTEIIATIDELNQYLQGNVTDEAIIAALQELFETEILNDIFENEKFSSSYVYYELY